AAAAVLCANTSGSLFVRQGVCRAGEEAQNPAALGLQGPQGPPGTNGAPGTDGTNGTNGVSGYEVVHKHEEVTNAEEAQKPVQFGIEIACPAGKKVLGGGGSGVWLDALQHAHEASLASSAPFVRDGLDYWFIGIQKSDGAVLLVNETFAADVWAICATVQ